MDGIGGDPGDIVYYVAASLDGYIATPEGGVDWLSAVEREGEDYGYGDFISSIDLLLMGRATYDFARSVDPWPYRDMRGLVFTHRPLPDPPPGVQATTRGPAEALSEPRAEPWTRAWLVGGGKLAASFRAAGLITESIVSIVPVVLGEGIPLFDGSGPLEQLELVSSRSFPSGLVQNRYRRR
jgi:dihydrofolate reductase